MLEMRGVIGDEMGMPSADYFQIGNAIGLCSMSDSPANVSTLAAMASMTRRRTKRILDKMVEDGYIQQIEPPDSSYPLYVRTLDPAVQMRVSCALAKIGGLVAQAANDLAALRLKGDD